MKQVELQNKIAQLEFINDQLTAEIDYLDQLLRSVGFPSGIDSAKAVALEMIDSNLNEGPDHE